MAEELTRDDVIALLGRFRTYDPVAVNMVLAHDLTLRADRDRHKDEVETDRWMLLEYAEEKQTAIEAVSAAIDARDAAVEAKEKAERERNAALARERKARAALRDLLSAECCIPVDGENAYSTVRESADDAAVKAADDVLREEPQP